MGDMTGDVTGVPPCGDAMLDFSPALSILMDLRSMLRGSYDIKRLIEK
jgi:hypothetical protein